MASDTQTVIPLLTEDDIVVARQRAREVARDLGFGMVDQSRIATAVSELTRNVIRYATGAAGEVRVSTLSRDGRVGLQVVVEDHGPGIPDVQQAMQEGYTSGPGLGMGLPGTRRLMDDMEVDSVVGRGTVVVIRKWRR